MRSLARKPRRWKKKVVDRREAVRTMQEMAAIDDLDVKVSLIQSLIPVGLERVNELLQEEVSRLAGKKGTHGKVNTCWGRQWGSVFLGDQKTPLEVPRVRNKARNQEVPLEAYHKLQHPYQADEQVFKKLLNGLSMRKYAESAEIVPEVFGLSASNMSRRFKTATVAKLHKLMNRDLSRCDFVAMFIDGKRFSEEGIVIAVGITIEGQKVILGLSQRENVTSHLAKGQQIIWRRKLQAAYAKATYQEAEAALSNLVKELAELNPSAANSLKEGISDTLTLHKLGLNRILKRSFSTTNCIESILAQVEQYTQRVDRWRGGSHIQRWVASGLLEIEPRLKRVYGWRQFHYLREKIKQELERRKKEQAEITEEQELIQVGA